jgi:hypothetical protein
MERINEEKHNRFFYDNQGIKFNKLKNSPQGTESLERYFFQPHLKIRRVRWSYNFNAKSLRLFAPYNLP